MERLGVIEDEEADDERSEDGYSQGQSQSGMRSHAPRSTATTKDSDYPHENHIVKDIPRDGQQSFLG